MQLFARAICYPPLGQTTVVANDQLTVTFNVVIEVSKSYPEQKWEAEIWHNGNQLGQWAGLALKETTAPSTAVCCLNIGTTSNASHHAFIGRMLRPADKEPIHFTLRYRANSSGVWKWVNEGSQLKDGDLCFQPYDLPENLEEYFDGYDKSVICHWRLDSEVPDTKLWRLSLGRHGLSENHKIGTPRRFTRWFSLVRHSTPWLAPRHGHGKFNCKEDAVISAFLRWDGLHLVLLPISGIDTVLSVLKSDRDGNLILHSRRDREKLGSGVFGQMLLAVGRTFETALASAMYEARKMVDASQSVKFLEKSEAQDLLTQTPRPTWMEDWFDGLIYCTWNGLGQDLNQQKIFDVLDVLKANDIHITNLIIDDNWQSLDNAGDSQWKRGMTDFEANKEGFPNGLKYTVTEIRDQHPNIEHVAVWHALFGYWGGISPTGKLARRYKTKEVRKQPGIAGGTMTVIDADDAGQYLNDFYKFLLESGVDSVKADAQFFLDLLDDAEDRRRFITPYQDAWTIASLRYFSLKAISCMSQVPQIMFHSQLPVDKPRLLVRNSDDYFPDVPKAHPWHIWANAHNALFSSHLNVVPDWDMFQTLHPYGSFHAAGRCVSGGPIAITDKPGEHDMPLINQVTARTTQGKTVILRSEVVGKTSGTYTAYAEQRILRVGTFVGGKGGISILGCFNVSEHQVYEFVHLTEFRGIEPGEEYTIYSFDSGVLSAPMTLDGQFPLVSLKLERSGWDILTAYPLRSFTLRGSECNEEHLTKTAPLGLIGKMTGAAALLSSTMQIVRAGRLMISVTLKALGVLGIYISTLPCLSIKDHLLITISDQVIPVHTVSISKTSPLVLEVDVERAWNEMGLSSSWSNELTVKVFIT